MIIDTVRFEGNLGCPLCISACPYTVMSSLCLNEKYFDRIFIPTNNEIITKIKLKLP